ncbi:hypothetical protein JCM10908_005702 [Rhodotorula pacifica]|uniref:uncharacterized protein n=1 Tax=Rhodotorula pacifica TaxID=1495444 RepID=UPI003178A879
MSGPLQRFKGAVKNESGKRIQRLWSNNGCKIILNETAFGGSQPVWAFRLGSGFALPQSLFAVHTALKSAQAQQWAVLWAAEESGKGLRAITSAPPGNFFARFHHSLTRRQSTLLSQLRTGVCNLGAYRSKFEPEKLLCECGKVKTQEHFFISCPIYATQRDALYATLRVSIPPTVASLLGDPQATPAVLRFVADSGRFDSLYSPPKDEPEAGEKGA